MIYIDKTSKTSLYEQVYEQLVEQIKTGQMPAGSKLVPTRTMAAELAVGRNTVDKAYQQLKDEGYVEAVPGSGFVVNDLPYLPESHGSESRKGPERQKKQTYEYDFVYGSMENKLFPYRKWGSCMKEALLRLENGDIAVYPEKDGEMRLREAICSHLKQARNVDCSPEQILITCGHQFSMEIIANIFSDGGARTGVSFVMEDPGYDGIRKVFMNRNFEVSAIPVEEDGIDIRPLEGKHVDLLYLTPSHQFPSGAVLSAGKRMQLLNWAQQAGSYILEDDYDSELRYYTNPIPSMQSMDNGGRIIYTGTFSKSLSPGMRLAYIVFPPDLMQRYHDFYYRYNGQVNIILQQTLAIYIEKGYFEQQVNRIRTAYRRKMRALITALEDVFGEDVRIQGGKAGMHLLVEFFVRQQSGELLIQEELIDRASDCGIRLYSTRPLYWDQKLCPPQQVLMGISTIPEDKMHEICLRLREAFESADGGKQAAAL